MIERSDPIGNLPARGEQEGGPTICLRVFHHQGCRATAACALGQNRYVPLLQSRNVSFWPTLRSGYLARERPHESRKEKYVQPAPRRLDFGLLRDLQRVIYLYPEVSHSTFELAMTKQELNGP